MVDDPRDPWQLRLVLDPATRGPDDVAGLAAAVVDRGGFRLGPVDLAVRRGDRIAVTGPNGSGKSTLLAALLGRLPVTAGRAWIGRSVVVGEVDQVRRTFVAGQPLAEAFRAATGQDEAAARTLLAKFGLGADDVLRAVGSLSPGERTRADLALLMARRANLLVLDEPTNHLDLAAIEAARGGASHLRRDAVARQSRPAAAATGDHRPARPRGQAARSASSEGRGQARGRSTTGVRRAVPARSRPAFSITSRADRPSSSRVAISLP